MTVTEKGPVQILPQITHCTYTSCLNIVQPYKQLENIQGRFLWGGGLFCFKAETFAEKSDILDYIKMLNF